MNRRVYIRRKDDQDADSVIKRLNHSILSGIFVITALIGLLFVSNYITSQVSYCKGYVMGKEFKLEWLENKRGECYEVIRG